MSSPQSRCKTEMSEAFGFQTEIIYSSFAQL